MEELREPRKNVCNQFYGDQLIQRMGVNFFSVEKRQCNETKSWCGKNKLKFLHRRHELGKRRKSSSRKDSSPMRRKEQLNKTVAAINTTPLIGPVAGATQFR
jgi:hypothetical protein